jgi:hypothetical protein
MVKTKTRKTPTLDSVRKVKSGVTELVLQNQKLKKKCRKLKKKVAKLETTSKTYARSPPKTFVPVTGRRLLRHIGLLHDLGAHDHGARHNVSKLTPYQQNIWKHTISMFETLDILDKDFGGRFWKFIHNIPPALMSRHAKTIAAGLLHSSVKPELNKRVMQEKIGVSVPTISQVSRIINLI